MGKSELFYAVGEYTDDAKYCKSNGLKPHKTVMKSLDRKPFPVVIEYSKDGNIYASLGADKCYSGYMVTLMRLPELPFEELLSVALTAKRIEDRAGALGIILKKYASAFAQYLLMIKQKGNLNPVQKKQIALVTTFIYDFIREKSSYIQEMEDVLSLCKELKTKYADMLPRFKWVRLFRYGV